MVTGCTRGLPNKPKLFGKKFSPSSVWTGFRMVLLIYRFPWTQNWTCGPVLQNDRTLDQTLVRFWKVQVQTLVQDRTAAALDQGFQPSMGVMLCCISLGIHLTPISLSLPWPHPLVFFVLHITLHFHLHWIPWSPCDLYALPLPHVLLFLTLLIFFSLLILLPGGSLMYYYSLFTCLLIHLSYASPNTDH